MLRSLSIESSAQIVNTLQPSTSPRPGVIVDPRARGVGDPHQVVVGRPGPFGRERVVFALPLDPGPCQLAPPKLLLDAGAAVIGGGGLALGFPAIWVARMHTARWTEDTRRLAG